MSMEAAESDASRLLAPLVRVQQLQVRSKWHKTQKNAAVGQLVVVRDERVPPSLWLIGRIIAVHPGKDGLVRVVTLKTATSTIKRPISKISILPVSTDTADETLHTAESNEAE